MAKKKSAPASASPPAGARKYVTGERWRHIPLSDRDVELIRDVLGNAIGTKLGRERRELSERIKEFFYGKETDPLYVATARDNHYIEGETEVDDSALVSYSTDGGAWVMAWVWVSQEDIPQPVRANWKNTLFPHSHIGHMAAMVELARQLGYEYFVWNDRIYHSGNSRDTGLTLTDDGNIPGPTEDDD